MARVWWRHKLQSLIELDENGQGRDGQQRWTLRPREWMLLLDEA